MEQEISKRMVLRVDALNAVESAILPSFCEDMKCDATCPLWVDKECPNIELACVWFRHTRALADLKCATKKAKYIGGL